MTFWYSLQSLRNVQLGILIGLISIGGYGLVLVGPYDLIGTIYWAPHAYNYVLWGSFGLLLSYRWKYLMIPAVFLIYSIDEIIWTSTYVITECNHDTFGRPWFWNGSGGYFVMIIVIAITSFLIIRPRIKLRWYVWIPWLVWFAAYVLVFHMPIVGNECLPATIPSNLPWEIAWQFSWIVPAWLTFYPSDRARRTPIPIPESSGQ